ncbi:hypothetical protein AMK21_01045 [Streptomyces sp. CB00316]|uniref:hypothetical protein n=1 Tax=unclassified Streptomyces TaxID=2593676 RepID=UPI00093ED219|nr:MULTISPECIES: hypothetical protein [unclassified Streptomyces]MBT2380311.1 hypothetical protein [Streptomyces sp. ISL-111]OKJ24114.1 hypothetical protein AMK21_01045 [Streptomyces sp. CB00316]
MDIPDWYVWIAVVLALLQALALVPVIRRLRESDSAVRSEARLDLLDAVGGGLITGGLLLGLVVAERWFWLTLAGFALIAAVYAVKGVRLLRARRRPMA